jgi:DNA-binding GntR family transcriptional regulator
MIENGSSLSKRVFNKLESDIINGIYKEGDSLNESRICEELGVSRTPVREAVRQLEHEGLVKIVPNKGALILGVSRKDIEDICAIRMLMEGLAARWAAENITDEEIDELKELIELSEYYTNSEKIPKAHMTDNEFHEKIYKATKSKSLQFMLRTFHHYTQKARGISLKTPGRAAKVLEEHKAILNAIISRDPQKAEKVMNQHIKNASKSMLKQ